MEQTQFTKWNVTIKYVRVVNLQILIFSRFLFRTIIQKDDKFYGYTEMRKATKFKVSHAKCHVNTTKIRPKRTVLELSINNTLIQKFNFKIV